MGARQRQSRRAVHAVGALAAAVALHVAALPLLGWSFGSGGAPRIVDNADNANDANNAENEAENEAAMPEVLGADTIASVQLLDESAALGPRLAVVIGAADASGRDEMHPLPESGIDSPGRRAAAAGGEVRGGRPVLAERRYRHEARQEMWNGKRVYRRAHRAGNRRRASDEWINREPKRGFDDQTRRASAAVRSGAERGQRGVAAGEGAAERGPAVEQPRWDVRDPLFDPAARPAVQVRRSGGVAGKRRRALALVGERAVEAGRRGAASDDRAVAAASNETDPMPLDTTSPGAGGRDRGVRGSRRHLGLAPGSRGGAGSAASRAAAVRGDGQRALRASRSNRYFRRFYRRVDKQVRFPRELALRLEQGQLVVRLELGAAGELRQIKVVKPSPFRAFDDELVRALRAAAPFGAVPAALLKGRSRLVVLAPYTFSNPMIR